MLVTCEGDIPGEGDGLDSRGVCLWVMNEALP